MAVFISEKLYKILFLGEIAFVARFFVCLFNFLSDVRLGYIRYQVALQGQDTAGSETAGFGSPHGLDKVKNYSSPTIYFFFKYGGVGHLWLDRHSEGKSSYFHIIYKFCLKTDVFLSLKGSCKLSNQEIPRNIL